MKKTTDLLFTKLAALIKNSLLTTQQNKPLEILPSYLVLVPIVEKRAGAGYKD